jgi:hypothetical protein
MMNPTMGLAATRAQQTDFNRYERSWLRLGDPDSSLIADLCRAARLAGSAPGCATHDADIDATFACVVAPLLVAFVEHVLEDCRARGIDEIAFMARDGQLPMRIACKIVQQRALPVRMRYLYGSRHALHLPAFAGIDGAQSWLLEDTTHLSLADIAERGDLPPELVEQAGRRFGYHGLHADIARRDRAGLRQVIREPSIEAALHARAAARWADCHAYYAGCGLTPGARVALVDVGWSGRMQASLRSILDRAGGPAVHLTGHYLCLVSKTVTSEHDEVLGFLHDPQRDGASCPFVEYRAVIESALMADHATTTGFARDSDGIVVPRFGPPPPAQQVATARLQQAAVLRFVDLMLQHERARGQPIRWPKEVVARHLRWTLELPTLSDARAFAQRTHFDGQGDRQESRLLWKLPLGPSLLRWRALGLWPEGTYRFSGAGALLVALKAARWLKSR